jgi:fatty acid desaturase
MRFWMIPATMLSHTVALSSEAKAYEREYNRAAASRITAAMIVD